MKLPRGSYPSYCYSGDYPTRGKRSCSKCHGVLALNCTAKLKSPAVWACGVDPLDMPRTPYQASDGGGVHLGFMHQRDLKIKLNLINEFIVLITLWKVVLHIFSAKTEEMIFFKMAMASFWIYASTRSKNIFLCQKWVYRANYTLKSGITHLFQTNSKKKMKFQ